MARVFTRIFHRYVVEGEHLHVSAVYAWALVGTMTGQRGSSTGQKNIEQPVKTFGSFALIICVDIGKEEGCSLHQNKKMFL